MYILSALSCGVQSTFATATIIIIDNSRAYRCVIKSKGRVNMIKFAIYALSN